LAAVRPYPTNIFLGKEGNRAVAVENDPKQMHIRRQIEEEKMKRAENVFPMEQWKGGEE
jgi:hypothetical protein